MNFKNEKGITLTTLVITVIVMLILATITISASEGDKGLVDETEDATIKISIREIEEALESKKLLKEKEEIKKGNFSNIKISVLTGKDTEDDETDDILEFEGPDKENKYNVYKIDISKLNIKGKYGKGTAKDIFKVKVKLESETETDDYVVEYIR